MLLPCFVCGKKLDSAIGHEEVNQPHDGTVFFSYGHYGSTVWDPMSRSGRVRLEVTICDLCLLATRERTQVVVTDRTTSERSLEWDPSIDY